MKTAFSVLGQLCLFALFLAVFFFGGFLGLFHLDPFRAPHWFVTPTGYFLPTGLLLMLLVYALVLAIEAAAGRLRAAGLWTSIAFLAALVIGLVGRFGWVHPS